VAGDGIIGILHVQQLVEQAKLGVVANIVGHRKDLVTQALQLRNRPEGDPRGRFLVHRMDHDIAIVKGEDPVGLVTMCQKTARDSLSRDQSDHRMSFMRADAYASAAAAATRKIAAVSSRRP